MAFSQKELNGRNVFEPTSQGMSNYAKFIDENKGGGGGGSGSDNYNDLTNKPRINDVQLSGNKTSQQLGLASNYAAEVLATMPSSPTARQTVMYVGEDTGDFVNGNTYRYSGTAWVLIHEQAAVESIPLEDIDGLFA